LTDKKRSTSAEPGQGRGDRALGLRIRKYRNQLGLSQEALAHRIGRSEGWMLLVENGRTDLAYSDLVKLAAVFRVDASQLLQDETEGSAKPEAINAVSSKTHSGVTASPDLAVTKPDLLTGIDRSEWFDDMSTQGQDVSIAPPTAAPEGSKWRSSAHLDDAPQVWNAMLGADSSVPLLDRGLAKGRIGHMFGSAGGTTLSLTGQWWAAWQTFNQGEEIVATQPVEIDQHGVTLRIRALKRSEENVRGGYVWAGQLRICDNQVLMGWYTAQDQNVRSRGTFFFVLHAQGNLLEGRWTGTSYDGPIVSGWGSIAQEQDEAAAIIGRLKGRIAPEPA
jgi:transcriptional regulator with XRE-family HTH domain